MLTVKHIAVSGEEMIYPTPRVNFVPSTAKEAASNGDSLWIYDETGRAHELYGGTVYVMNENGKTVSRYDLGGWVLPSAKEPKVESHGRSACAPVG
jgi:hypothetical protein